MPRLYRPSVPQIDFPRRLDSSQKEKIKQDLPRS